MRSQLSANDEQMRLIALEVLIARKKYLSDGELLSLIKTNHPEIQALTCVAALEASSNNIEVQTICQQVLYLEMDSPSRLAVIRGIRSTGNRKLIPLLKTILTDATAEIKREALDALTSLAHSGDLELGKLAVTELGHSNPPVRAAALKLLGVLRSPSLLQQVAKGLENIDLAVRLCAATALASYGNISLSTTQEYLNSPRPEVQEAAIAAIGKVKTRQAADILYNHLKPDFQRVINTQRWLQQIPQVQPPWEILEIVLQDYHERLIHRVLYILSNLDHEGTLSDIRRILSTQDIRLRANAVETLAALHHRRFVLPILPLFEPSDPEQTRQKLTKKEQENLLKETMQSGDRWIWSGALLVMCSQENPTSTSITLEPPPMLKTLAEKTFPLQQTCSSEDSFFLNRVLFLKTIPLLRNLFLDELLLINSNLIEEKFKAGATIYTEGNLVKQLSIIYKGSVVMLQQIGDSQQSLAQLNYGQYFGEITLFDDSPRSTTAIANTDCTLLTLSRDNFNKLINLFPRLLVYFSQSSNISF